jgi:hypothetical protein
MTVNAYSFSRGKMFSLMGTAILVHLAGVVGGSAPARAENVLITCATDSGTCIVPNTTTTVTYGKNGAILVRTAGVTQLICDATTFGGDPLRGVVKSCTYTVDPMSMQWIQCAQEGQTCGFTGARFVRFGANGKWVYSSYIDGVACNRETFGDPIVGTPKMCFVGS